jgi:hypothetical protein
MKLVDKLLNSSDPSFKHVGFTYEANKELIEQLLSNYAIEMAGMDSVVKAIENIESNRIKKSILNRLGDFNTSSRFSIQCNDRDSFITDQELIDSFKFSLTYKYWVCILERLNVQNLLPLRKTISSISVYYSAYVQEDHKEFNLDNIKELLSIFQNDLYKENEMLEFYAEMSSTYEVKYEEMKSGELKILNCSHDTFDNFKAIFVDLISAVLYKYDPEWYLNNSGTVKYRNTDVKGISWTNFKNSKHILTLDKPTADLFKKYYSI